MLEIRHVTKKYATRRKGRQVAALRDVHLSFGKTGLVFIVGKSGSGKSTLLNILGGLDRPTSGQVLVNGRDISTLTTQEANAYRSSVLGFVFQDFHLVDHLTVAENVALSLSLQAKRDDEAVEAVLADMGLAGYGGRRVSELSGGECQRVAIARSLIKSPEIILADEPTGNLDSKTSTQIMEILKELSKKSLVIVVSHNLGDAYRYGDRIVELRDGEVIVNKQRRDAYVNEFSMDEGVVTLPYNKQLTDEQLRQMEQAAASGALQRIRQLDDGFFDVIEKGQASPSLQKHWKRGIKLPFSVILKLFLRYMRHQKAICTMTALLCVLLVTLFALVQSFLLFDEAGVYATVFGKESGGVFLAKGYWDEEENELDDEHLVDVSDADIAVLREAGYEGEIYWLNNFNLPVSGSQWRICYGRWINPKDNLGSFYLHETYGTLVCDAAYLERTFAKDGEIEVLAGDLNDTSGLIITDYVADALIYYQAHLNTYEDLIGELKTSNAVRARIAAVIATDYREQFAPLCEELLLAKREQDGDRIDKLVKSDAGKEFYIAVSQRLGVCYTLDHAFLESAHLQRNTTRAGNVTFTQADEILRRYEDIIMQLDPKQPLEGNQVIMGYSLYNRIFGTAYTTKNLKSFTPHTVTIKRYATYSNAISTPIFEQEIEIAALANNTSTTLTVSPELYACCAENEFANYALMLADGASLGRAYRAVDEAHFYASVDGYELVINVTRIIAVFEEFFLLIVAFIVLVTLFVVLFFTNFIIQKNRKSIGIMRALGMRNRDVMKIFTCQIALVIASCAAIVAAGYFSLIRWGNGVLQSAFYKLFADKMVFEFTLLEADVSVILADLAVLGAVALCSVLAELVILRRINVIEIIRSAG